MPIIGTSGNNEPMNRGGFMGLFANEGFSSPDARGRRRTIPRVSAMHDVRIGNYGYLHSEVG